VRLEISSESHPFWTGTMRELDADGKIERFRKRYAKAGIDTGMTAAERGDSSTEEA